MAVPGTGKPTNRHVVFWRGRPLIGALESRTSRMTGNDAAAVKVGRVGSAAVIVTVCGAIVLTGGATTCVAMLPAPSACALPDAPPPIEMNEPGSHCAPTTGTCAPCTKQAPWAASVAPCAAPGAASAAVAVAAAAILTFIPARPPEATAERVERRGRGRGRGRPLHTHAVTG